MEIQNLYCLHLLQPPSNLCACLMCHCLDSFLSYTPFSCVTTQQGMVSHSSADNKELRPAASQVIPTWTFYQLERSSIPRSSPTCLKIPVFLPSLSLLQSSRLEGIIAHILITAEEIFQSWGRNFWNRVSGSPMVQTYYLDRS